MEQDPYGIKLPRIYGRWNGVFEVEKTLGITRELFASMAEHDRNEIVNWFVWLLERYQHIDRLPAHLHGDLDSAVARILDGQPDYGASRWHSLHFAEKVLKASLLARGESKKAIRKFSHNLAPALNRAEELGLPAGNGLLVAQVQSNHSIRYEHLEEPDERSTMRQAIMAYQAAVDLASEVAKYWNAPPQTVDATADRWLVSFAHATISNYGGMLVFRCVFSNGTQKDFSFAPATIGWLAEALRGIREAGRLADDRPQLRSYRRTLSNLFPRSPIRIFATNEPTIDHIDSPRSVAVHKFIAYQNAIELVLEDSAGALEQMFLLPQIGTYLLDYVEGALEGGREQRLPAFLAVPDDRRVGVPELIT